MKNRKIRAVTLSLNPTIQSLILHMYTIFEDFSLHSFGENCDTNYALKDRKWTNKGKNKSKEFDSQSNNTTTHYPCVYQVNKILAITVPEKTVIQKSLTELRVIMDRPNPV